MINEKNKVALNNFSPWNPFPTNSVDWSLKMIYWRLQEVSSSYMSPQKIIELAEDIQESAFEIKQKVTEWKESV